MTTRKLFKAIIFTILIIVLTGCAASVPYSPIRPMNCEMSGSQKVSKEFSLSNGYMHSYINKEINFYDVDHMEDMSMESFIDTEHKTWNVLFFNLFLGYGVTDYLDLTGGLRVSFEPEFINALVGIEGGAGFKLKISPDSSAIGACIAAGFSYNAGKDSDVKYSGPNDILLEQSMNAMIKPDLWRYSIAMPISYSLSDNLDIILCPQLDYNHFTIDYKLKYNNIMYGRNMQKTFRYDELNPGIGLYANISLPAVDINFGFLIMRQKVIDKYEAAPYLTLGFRFEKPLFR